MTQTPTTFSIAVRLAIAAALCLGLWHHVSPQVHYTLLPAYRSVFGFLTSDFDVQSFILDDSSAQQRFIIRANLAHPIVIGTAVVHPFGTDGTPSGFLQIRATTEGSGQSALIALILSVAWPFRTRFDAFVRGVILIAMCPLLLFVDLEILLLGNAYGAVATLADLTESDSLLFRCAKFLEGGGSLFMGLVFGACVIGIGRRLSLRAAAPPRP